MIKFNSLPVIPLRITSGYGNRDTGIKGATKWHDGVDLGRNRNKPGDCPILAVMDGTVCSSYWNKYRGWVLIIDHCNGVQTLYQHLKAQGLPVGTSVKAGQQIAVMGQTGVGAGLHLHFELRINGKCVDPTSYLFNIKEEESEDEMVAYKTFKDLPSWYKEGVGWYIKNGYVNDGKPLDSKIDENYAINMTESTARALQAQYNALKGLNLI